MVRPILLHNVRLPLSHQWKDTTVEILMDGQMIRSIQPQVVLGKDQEREVERIDGGGRVVLPGFVDAHAHLVQTALAAPGADLSPATTIAEALDLLRQYAKRSSASVVYGHTFDPSALKEHRYFTLDELDSLEDVVKGRVVWVPRRDYHSAVVNRTALKVIPFPKDGVGIELSEDGKTPSGILKHQAAGAAMDYYHGALSPAERQRAIRELCKKIVARGITTVHVLEEPSLMNALLPIRDALPLDTVPYTSTLDVSIPLANGFQKIGGCECTSTDGSFSSHTAALDEPYYDRPEERGVLYFEDEQLFAFVEEAHAKGLQICLHALADRAVAQVLDAYENALKKHPRDDHRHRIEHAELIRPEDYQRISEGKFYLSMQPVFEGIWGGPEGMYAQYLGPERRKRTNTFREWWDLGVVIAGGSDANVTPFDALAGIHWLVNNPNEEQRLTVGEAIQVFTENGAKIAFEDTVKGWGVPGFQADLVVLEENPFDVPQRIKEIDVALTFHRGQKVYQKQPAG